MDFFLWGLIYKFYLQSIFAHSQFIRYIFCIKVVSNIFQDLFFLFGSLPSEISGLKSHIAVTILARSRTFHLWTPKCQYLQAFLLGQFLRRRIFQPFAKRDKRLAANRRAEEYQRTAKNIFTRYVFSLEIHASQLLFIQCLTSGLRQGIPLLFLFPIEITSCHLKSC